MAEKRGGAVGEASGGQGCGKNEGYGLLAETLKETPHWSCINRLSWTDKVFKVQLNFLAQL